MKTDAPSHAVESTTHAKNSYEPGFSPESKSKLTKRTALPGLSLYPDPAESTSPIKSNLANNGWNTLQPRSREAMADASLKQTAGTAIMFGNSMQASFPSMVISFMVMCIKLFADLQKAQNDMALNQLNFMVIDMKREIDELIAERDSNKLKDFIMAGIEAVSAAVQLGKH